MSWHLSKSDPRKVYDGCHQSVCVCQTQDQAALIVKAVNGLGPQTDSIKLREPFNPLMPPSPFHSGPATDSKVIPPALTHVTVAAEGCCGKHIVKASMSGALDRMQPWECPKCGTTYWPRREGPVINWEARAAVMVFKPSEMR